MTKFNLKLLKDKLIYFKLSLNNAHMPTCMLKEFLVSVVVPLSIYTGCGKSNANHSTVSDGWPCSVTAETSY